MHALLLIVLTALPSERTYVKDRFDGHAISQLYADGFEKLSLAEKQVAWHLTLAAHAGEDIAYDQTGWNNVALKRLLEGVYLFGRDGKKDPSGFDAKLTEYLTRFYGHVGNHDSVTGQKFVPAFTFEELSLAAARALGAGAPLGVKDEAGLRAALAQLRPTLFDSSFEPQLTCKAPPPGEDILTCSSNTAYGREVTLKDLEGFDEKYPLNSRLVRQAGKLVEQVFRAGTADKKVAPGLYAAELGRVIAHVRAAARVARPDQRRALEKLIRYFQTGAPKDWDAYNVAWLRSNPAVDANLGFIETYVDARGQKGQWEGLINYKDTAENRVMELLGRRAQYFEDRTPWPELYKRKKITLPVAKAIAVITASPTPPAGINLPNEQHIRERYGSKSVLVSNAMETSAALKRLPLAIEFSRTAEEKEQARQYAVIARKWLVAFHEVAGHASGRVDPKIGDVSKKLKEYDNTLEEARADLVALWHVFDPALKELHPEHEAIAREMYRDFLIEGLTNLQRVEKGDSFEEDHQRGHHMTVNYLMERGAVQQVQDERKRTYWVPTDVQKMREAVGELLTRLMVIKATGDYDGIHRLVTNYGIKFDPKLRDEVAARVKAVNVPTYIFMTSPSLVPVVDANARITNVRLSTEQSFLDQHLERSLLGRLPPGEATKVAAQIGGSSEGLRKAWNELGARLTN